MRRRGVLGVLAFLAAIPNVQAQQSPPPQEPFLRIEAGMHTANIGDGAVSGDDKFMVTASNDKTIRVWSLPDGRLTKVLRVPIGPGNGGKVYAVALSPDGGTVAAGGWDAADPTFIYLFDFSSGAIIKRLGPLSNAPNSLAYSPDGRFLAAGLFGTSGIRIWDASNGHLIAQDLTIKDTVEGMSFDQSGRLAVASYDSHIRLYDESLHQIAKVDSPGGKQPFGIAFSPDGRKIAVGYHDTSAVDVLDGTTLATLFSADTKGSSGNLAEVTWSVNGQSLFAGGTYGAKTSPILRWRRGGRGEKEELPGSPNTILSLSPWGKGGVAFTAFDPAIGLVDADGKSVLYRGAPGADMRTKIDDGLLISADAKRVRFGFGVGAANPWLFDVENGKFVHSDSTDNLHRPIVKGLPVTDWFDTYAPKVGDMPIPLSTIEKSRSLAILANQNNFILGSEWNIRRFDMNGKELWAQAAPGVTWGVNTSSDEKIVVAAYGDGTIRWHRASDGQELLAFYALLPKDGNTPRWVLWTPKGYYTASPGGEDLIGWHINGKTWDDTPEFYPASRFRDQFYRPDIVKGVLDTLDEDKAVEAANAAANRAPPEQDIRKRQPPSANIINIRDGDSFSSPKLRIDYSVRSPSGLPVKRVWALVDGREVDTTKGLVPVAASQPQGLTGSLFLDLPPHDVTVAVLAETDEGIASAPTPIKLVWTGARSAANPTAATATTSEQVTIKPRLYALLIGVSKYQDAAINALDYADKDARDMQNVLTLQKGRLYSDVQIKILTNDQATQRGVMKGLGWIASAPAQGDVALVFISGHGFTNPTGDYQFIPYDAEVQKTELGIVPVAGTGVPHSEILGAMKQARRAHTFFLFDTCNAGDATGVNSKGFNDDYSKFISELTSSEAGVRVLASSAGQEASIEAKIWQNGAFTKALIEGLNGAADYDHNGVVSINELNSYVERRVQDLTANQQHPEEQAPGMVRDIPLVAVAP